MLRRLPPALLCLALSAGCGDDGRGESANASDPEGTTQSQDEAPPAEPAEDEPPLLREEPPPPPEPNEDVPVDEMTEAQLDAACFEGRQAACDRLGH